MSSAKIIELPDEPLPATDEEAKTKALELRSAGNSLYTSGKCAEAIVKYTDALGLSEKKELIEAHLLFSNRAACYLMMASYEQAIDDCNSALAVSPNMMKALFRRGQAYDKLGKGDEALKDYEASVAAAKEQSLPVPAVEKDIARLKKEQEERREKEKDEVLGKLKDLGNLVLGKFGMSLDNFALNKDPVTGSYSVQMKQGGSSTNPE